MDIEILFVTNDAVGVLAAGKYVHPDVDIGIVLGTGTNAAIVKEPEDMPKWKPAVLSKKRYQAVVNIEWGGYHSESLPINEFDKALLTEKDQPDFYGFERMITGNHLGELCRLLILAIYRDDLHYFGAKLGNLVRPFSFPTELVSAICTDDSDFTKFRPLLVSHLNIQPASFDLALIKEACEMVVHRAVLLLSCALAGVMLQHYQGTEQRTPVIVAIDGAIFVHLKRFQQNLPKHTKRILEMINGPDTFRFELRGIGNAPSVGVAAIAATYYDENKKLDTKTFPELAHFDY